MSVSGVFLELFIELTKSCREANICHSLVDMPIKLNTVVLKVKTQKHFRKHNSSHS